MFPHQNYAYIYLSPIRATYPTHLVHLYIITRKLLDQYNS